MVAYLLDANHAGTLITPTHPVRQRTIGAMAAGDTFALSLLAATETIFGFSVLPRAAANAREWDMLRPSLTLIPIDEADARQAASLQVMLRRRGWQLSTVDAYIAVAALRYDVILLTTDRDFAAVPGLTTENWLMP